MVTVRNATPQDGQPDTQWGFNDYALTFSRDAQGRLAQRCSTNGSGTICRPEPAVSIDAIHNADGDPSSGLVSSVVEASHISPPTDAEIEERLPFRLNPEDQLIRYPASGSPQNTYVVVRRPIYTDRCENSATGTIGNIFNMSPSLANALAFVGDRDNPSQWCADRRPQRDPGNGRLRMVTPFSLVGDGSHASTRALYTSLDRLETARAHPNQETNPMLRSLAATVSVSDIEHLRGQINDSLGFTGRLGYFVDEHPFLSGAIAVAGFIATAVGFGFFTPFGDKLHKRFFGDSHGGGGSTPPPHRQGPQTPAPSAGGPSATSAAPQQAAPTAGVETDASVEGPIDLATLPSESEQIRQFGPEVRQRPRTPQAQPSGATIPSQSGYTYLDYGVLGIAALTTAVVTGPALLAYFGIGGATATTTAATTATVTGAEVAAGLTAEQALLLRMGQAFTSANAAGILGMGGAAIEGARRAAPVVQRVVENALSH